eukprot:751759-Hanusia_phi.AAC.1
MSVTSCRLTMLIVLVRMFNGCARGALVPTPRAAKDSSGMLTSSGRCPQWFPIKGEKGEELVAFVERSNS